MRGDELAAGDVMERRLAVPAHLPAHLLTAAGETTHDACAARGPSTPHGARARDASTPTTDAVNATSAAAAALVARRRQRRSDDDVWTTDATVQTTGCDYARLVAATDDDRPRHNPTEPSDDDDTLDSCSLCVYTRPVANRILEY